MKSTAPLIHLSYLLKKRNELNYYKTFTSNINLPIDVLEQKQLEDFKKLFVFCKRNVPYYEMLFNSLKLNVTDFNTLQDLNKIPILTKDIILKNYTSLQAVNYKGKIVNGSTGGSTGKPLKYKLSIDDYSRGVALLYRGLGHGGYKPGDKLAVIAGGSLVKNKASLQSKLINKLLNYKKFSSFGIDDNDLNSIYNSLQQWRPKFLRGYSSSLALFAKFCIENSKPMTFQSVFSTAEMLLPSQRKLIEKAFNTKVYNNYGLNDGGISAYEHGEPNRFPIDTERAILEVVKENAIENTFNANGRLIATSLYNYAFPFIRYDTGDYATQLKSVNNSRHVLTNLKGRATDYISFKGKVIGSPVLTILMGKFDILKYQIIQKENETLDIRIQKGETFKVTDQNYIVDSLKSNLGNTVNINIIYTEVFKDSQNKHKFIIRE